MAKHPDATIDTICNAIQSYYPDAKLDIVRKAYEYATRAHEGQKRSSGDPYIIHPTEVSQTLVELKLDIPSIITGLLHDTVEDTEVTKDDLEAKFGKSIAEIATNFAVRAPLTAKTVPFFDEFKKRTNRVPVYTAFGTYDAIHAYAQAVARAGNDCAGNNWSQS